MAYDKEYFIKRLAEATERYRKASPEQQEKMRDTAESMAEKARSEMLVNIPLGEEYYFFYGSNSPFSQWYRSDFSIDGIHFSCAEQYMMYKKALLFDDDATANAIINSGYNPRQNKEQGRLIRGFNSDKWDKKKESIVRTGNYYKFLQNQEILTSLLETAPKILVEASPSDTVWGIGLSLDDPNRFHEYLWRGSNLLGYTLTSLRDELATMQVDKDSENLL